MKTRELTLLETDTGEQREFLANELVRWRSSGSWPLASSQRFHRRAKILAQPIDETFEDALSDLAADADALVAEQAATEERRCSPDATRGSSSNRQK